MAESSTVAQVAQIYVFRDQGWDAQTLRGGVYKAPEAIKDLRVDAVHAEWLHDDEDETKNHMCFRLTFEGDYVEEGKTYGGVMLSMEPNPAAGVVIEGHHKSLVSGRDFYPGIFTLKLLSYRELTKSARLWVLILSLLSLPLHPAAPNSVRAYEVP